MDNWYSMYAETGSKIFQRHLEVCVPFKVDRSFPPSLRCALNNIPDLEEISSKGEGTRMKDCYEIACP